MIRRFFILWWTVGVLLWGGYAWTGWTWQERIAAAREESLAREMELREQVQLARGLLAGAAQFEAELSQAEQRERQRVDLERLVEQWNAEAARRIRARVEVKQREQIHQLKAWVNTAGVESNISQEAMRTIAERIASAWDEIAGKYRRTARRLLEDAAGACLEGGHQGGERFVEMARGVVAQVLRDLEGEQALDLARMKLDLLVELVVQRLRAHVREELIPGERPREMVARTIRSSEESLAKWNAGLRVPHFDMEELRQARATLVRQGELLLAEERHPLRDMMVEPLAGVRGRLLDSLRDKLEASDEEKQQTLSQCEATCRDGLASALQEGIESRFARVLAGLKTSHLQLDGEVLIFVLGMEGMDSRAVWGTSLKRFAESLGRTAGRISWVVVTDRKERAWNPGEPIPFDSRSLCPTRRFDQPMQRALNLVEGRLRTRGGRPAPVVLLIWPCASNPNDLYDQSGPTINVPESLRQHFYWVGGPRGGRSNWLRANFGENGYSTVPDDEQSRLGEMLRDRLREWKLLEAARENEDGR